MDDVVIKYGDNRCRFLKRDNFFEMNVSCLREETEREYEKVIRRFAYVWARNVWKQAKTVLEKGNYSPFVCFDRLEERYVFIAGTHSEDLEFDEDERGLVFQGHDVVISPLVFQELFAKQSENDFAFFELGSSLEKHLKQTLANDVFVRDLFIR